MLTTSVWCLLLLQRREERRRLEEQRQKEEADEAAAKKKRAASEVGCLRDTATLVSSSAAIYEVAVADDARDMAMTRCNPEP
jgi:hypothetical protein